MLLSKKPWLEMDPELGLRCPAQLLHGQVRSGRSVGCGGELGAFGLIPYRKVGEACSWERSRKVQAEPPSWPGHLSPYQRPLGKKRGQNPKGPGTLRSGGQNCQLGWGTPRSCFLGSIRMSPK